MPRAVLVLSAAAALAAACVLAARPTTGASPRPADQMAAAARAFIDGLDEAQRAAALRPFDAELRERWHFVPMEREGVMWKTLSPRQAELATALLRTALSTGGYDKARLIMRLESVLAELEKDPVKRDPGKYGFLFFGQPPAGRDAATAGAAPWGWRLEGHHLSLHFTIVGGSLIATSPTFLGANPAHVRDGALQGTRALAAEEDVARRLVRSFTGAAATRVRIAEDAPDDIYSMADSRVGPLPRAGVAWKELSPAQRKLLGELIAVYTGTMTPALAAERLARLERAGRDGIQFAWAGGLDPGQRHYYRVQGPTFLIEYDNTQNDANHVHAVWRDFDGDFGRDLLREHLRAAHGR